jgi:Protein of unknown function (DUF2510)
MLTATMVPLASTAYDIGRAVGYVIVPVIIGAIILLIARRQDRSKGPAAATASVQANPFAPAAASAPARTPAPAQAATPPGWYDDPWRQARLRYWDGTAWTGHTAA